MRYVEDFLIREDQNPHMRLEYNTQKSSPATIELRIRTTARMNSEMVRHLILDTRTSSQGLMKLGPEVGVQRGQGREMIGQPFRVLRP
jgi:hypothetical protein